MADGGPERDAPPARAPLDFDHHAGAMDARSWGMVAWMGLLGLAFAWVAWRAVR